MGLVEVLDRVRMQAFVRVTSHNNRKYPSNVTLTRGSHLRKSSAHGINQRAGPGSSGATQETHDNHNCRDARVRPQSLHKRRVRALGGPEVDTVSIPK